jgi:hypothetical protein
VRKIILITLLSAGLSSGGASAQTTHTWLYAINADGGIAWNNTDLAWNEADKSFRGTLITYVKTANPMGDKAVNYVLEDFHLKCTGPEYFYENVIYYGPDKKMVSSMFATKKVPIDAASPYGILSAVLCQGANFKDAKLMRNVSDAAEVMSRLAES